MEFTRKRSYSSLVAAIVDNVNAHSISPSLEHRRKRQRQPKEFPSTSSFASLKEYFNYIVDVDDILEDYLSPQKRKDIRPLVLDMEDGDWNEIEEYDHLGVIIRQGACVRLKNGTFLRVRKIFLEFDHRFVVLRGHKLAHVSRLKPILDNPESKEGRDLFMDLQINRSLDVNVQEQAQIDVPIDWMDKEAIIHFSNCHGVHDAGHDAYYCRWKLTRYYEDTKTERRSVEVAIERLRDFEADVGHQFPDDALKFDWRGTTEKGGSDGSYYTAIDGFCCGGGWSRGATMAGNINIVRSFDKDIKACSTYSVNFPKTHCLNVDVFNYCLPDRLEGELQEYAANPKYIDIAHYSTPCQFFSPAHTREGPNDETNFAASFCLQHLLKKDKPRVVTFENTSGLERRHFSSLKAIFGQVTSLNYSLRFTCLNLADYGLPQNRKRLIMLASCPGEPLPTFPASTHSQDARISGTLPWVTLLEAIGRIPFEGWPNHHPKRMKKKLPPSKTKTLAPTITCAGGAEEIHPDGRLFTICEYQLLQGFPLDHRFAKELKRTHLRAQIGNAFPPLFVKKLLRHVRRQLQRTDGVSESLDEDEFMSTEEIRDREIARYLEDHEKLPKGIRANVVCTDGADDDDEDEGGNNFEDTTVAAENNEISLGASWSWITSSTNMRRSSNDSIISSTSSSQSTCTTSITFNTSSQTTPQSLREMYDTLDDSPLPMSSFRPRFSLTSMSLQSSRRTSGLGTSSSPTSLDPQDARPGQDVTYLGRQLSLTRPNTCHKRQGSSVDNPIEI